ncbi:MAG: hypothetical protein ACKOW9_00270 [Candidatus Paceibacterota bacterium]
MRLFISLLLIVFFFSPPTAQAKESNVCKSYLPKGVSAFKSASWVIPKGGSLVTPTNTSFCHFNYKGAKYMLITLKYKSSNDAQKAVNSLKVRDGFLFFGVPSGFYVEKPIKSYKEGDTLAGKVSTDDCGRFGDELFDTGCPLGVAAMTSKGDEVVVLSRRFEVKSGAKPEPARLLKIIAPWS